MNITLPRIMRHPLCRPMAVFLGPLLACVTFQVRAANLETVKIQLDLKTTTGQISRDFLGFGYETSAVAQADYFNSKNAVLIQLYRNLSSQGLIRIGGNVSDHTRYVPDGVPVVHSDTGVTIINKTNLADLAGFCRATGWKVMWGLNLGTGSKAEAVAEALAVSAALGNHLQSFEIGNEVDLHGGYAGDNHDYDSYYSNYLAYKAAIRSVLPQAAFSGPDVAGNIGWLKRFAGTESKDIKLLTHHYYRTGAKTPEATIENLLKRDTAWDDRLGQLQRISADSGVLFRINEVNSFYGGGKPGVSDTFASALWCLNYLFVLASYGCNGVNMETDINHLAWVSHYSPIVHDTAMNCSARPEYYGLLAFALAGQGELLKLNLDKGDINLSAYSTKDDQGVLSLTVINQDLTQGAELEIRQPDGCGKPEAFRLTAPSVESKDQVTFGGAEVSAQGKWQPKSPLKVPVKTGIARLNVPKASAVLVRWRQNQSNASMPNLNTAHQK